MTTERCRLTPVATTGPRTGTGASREREASRPDFLKAVVMNALSRSGALCVSVAVLSLSVLAGCQTETSSIPVRARQPLARPMLALLEQKKMAKEDPILVRIFKEESELEVWKQNRDGQMALLKTYPICRWSGELGPKLREGDRQAPEGFYTIGPAQMNPNSGLYLAFNLGYPNAFDAAHERTGSYLMVHGDCSSRGCYALTDEQIAEVYTLAREAFSGGQRAFQVQAFPFRMTPKNLARHRGNPNMPFWRNLKEGYDHFEVARSTPRVDVCERRYVFNAQAPGEASAPLTFNPVGRCPAYEVPEQLAHAVTAKRQSDDQQMAELVRAGIEVAPVRTNTDGGMHPVFVAKMKPLPQSQPGATDGADETTTQSISPNFSRQSVR
jgi:murein L,D-transpeptidase YafK